MCKEAGGGGEGARDTESKTRTPHKVVGKNTAITVASLYYLETAIGGNGMECLLHGF